MFSQLFGKYLVDKKIISDADYNTAIEQQLAVRVKLGTIAIADGLLTEEEVESINKMQMQFDKLSASLPDKSRMDFTVFEGKHEYIKEDFYVDKFVAELKK